MKLDRPSSKKTKEVLEYVLAGALEEQADGFVLQFKYIG